MTDENVFERKTAAYYTLGCKLNFAETSALGRSLLDLGIRSARTGEQADICVINTCSVTELADRKCRYTIRKVRREHPGAFVIVTGCYAQLSPEKVADIEGVDLVVGAEHKLDIPDLLRQRAEARPDAPRIVATRTADITAFRPSVSTEERARHFLKVQDGCDYHCTYCTIPRARGRSRSASVAETLETARQAVEAGARELVLTGVNIGDFGQGTSETLLDLLTALNGLDGLDRLRIGSIEPNLLSEDIIELCATSSRIAPHFHIPLQSGSDEVLRLMRRRYDRALFDSRVAYIRARMPHAFIGIDVIVGTRGELPEYFDETYTYLEGLPFSQLHVFSYSERRGTAALRIPYIVDTRERHRRSQLLQRLSDEKTEAFYRSQIGRPLRIIWEYGQREDGLMTGYSDNYVRVARPFDPELQGGVSHLTPTRLHEASLLLIE